MADRKYLDWPFLEARHKELAIRLDAWAGEHVSSAHEADVDQACRLLVRRLGEGGWLRYAIGGTAYGASAESIDTRAVCLIRATLAALSGLADFVLFARTGEPGAHGITAFLIEPGTPGFEIIERIEIMAPHPLARLTFTGCRIPVSQRLGETGQGFKVAMSTLDIFRTSVGAAAPGFARRALDEALRRATARKMFGQRLSDFQLTQAKLAAMATGIDAAAPLVYRAAWLGVVSDQPVERLYREIHPLRIYEGATEVQPLIIARGVIKAFEEGHARHV